jgi:hypothetical protein
MAIVIPPEWEVVNAVPGMDDEELRQHKICLGQDVKWRVIRDETGEVIDHRVIETGIGSEVNVTLRSNAALARSLAGRSPLLG